MIETGLSVQFGCGMVCPDGWTNFDISPSMLLSRLPLVKTLLKLPPWNSRVRYGDIVKGLPIEPQSASRVYSDQVLEHLTLNDCRVAMRNVLKMLKPGGVFRFFVPDLAYFVRLYSETSLNNPGDAAHQFIIDTGLGLTKRRSGFIGRVLDAFGNSHHLWGWDEHSLNRELLDAGFRTVRRTHYGATDDPLFKHIETYSEFRNCLKSVGMEAIR